MSLTDTDIFALVLSVFLLLRGASRGFLRSLTGPLSVVVCTFLSLAYYQATKDMVTSLLIGLIGPLVLNFFLKYLFLPKDSPDAPGTLSSLGGAALTLIWGWVFIVFALILVMALPLMGTNWQTMREDVLHSRSYAVAMPFEGFLFGVSQQNSRPAATPAAGNDAKALAQDPRFQKILQDPEIQREINAHDYVQLMSNPKMMAFVQTIMSDPQAMKKVLAVYKSQPSPASLK